MVSTSTIVAGALCGLVGSIAPAFLFEQALKPGTKVNMAAGLASILVSFVLLSMALLAVYVLASEKVLTFGCSMVAAYLLFWAVEAIRAWMAAQRGSKGL
jgi:threonine/homoserine/homoserine lactone efflux protein